MEYDETEADMLMDVIHKLCMTLWRLEISEDDEVDFLAYDLTRYWLYDHV